MIVDSDSCHPLSIKFQEKKPWGAEHRQMIWLDLGKEFVFISRHFLHGLKLPLDTVMI